MIGRLSVHNVKLGSRDAAYRSVPAIANSPVKVTRVEALKTLVQWHPSLYSHSNTHYYSTVQYDALGLVRAGVICNLCHVNYHFCVTSRREWALLSLRMFVCMYCVTSRRE